MYLSSAVFFVMAIQNPSVNEIIATEKYVSGYACKGNQPTGAIVDLFNDMVNCADESTGATTKSLCNKLLLGTVKRDNLVYETLNVVLTLDGPLPSLVS
jgi:hypothetical protein